MWQFPFEIKLLNFKNNTARVYAWKAQRNNDISVSFFFIIQLSFLSLFMLVFLFFMFISERKESE